MRTRQLKIFTLFFLLPVLVYSQTYYYRQLKGLSGHTTANAAKSLRQPGGIDTNYFILDYYLSDSYTYGTSYISDQRQLINNYYSYPADTANSAGKNLFSQNYDCINSISVAFDSLYTGSSVIEPWSLITIAIDTIYVPIIQVNHSLQSDSLIIELTNVTAEGYPEYNNYVLDTVLIDSAGYNNIGSGDNTIKVIKWPLNNYRLLGSSKFAVNVNYYDHSKRDSCWFVYGYGYFNRACPFEGTDSVFAGTTHFSNIAANPRDFTANSFAQWNEYTGFGDFPTSQGDNIFYPCVAADTDAYHPGIDGANYLQNIDIYACIQLVQNTGIDKINPTTLNVGQNYPNPFALTSSITYSLRQSANVVFAISDMTGRELVHSDYNNLEPGQHNIIINGATLQPGIYFYSITSLGYTVTKKMMVY